MWQSGIRTGSAGLGPRTSSKAVALPVHTSTQDSKLMDTVEINSFLAACPAGPGPSTPSPRAAGTALAAKGVLVAEGAGASSSSGAAALATAAAGPSSVAKAAVDVDFESECGDDFSTVPSTQGRAYDLTKVDEKLRKRLLKNRLSAERSRQRKQAHVEALEFELSCCRSENEHLKKRVANLEAQVSSMSLNAGCKPAQTFGHQEMTAVS